MRNIFYITLLLSSCVSYAQAQGWTNPVPGSTSGYDYRPSAPLANRKPPKNPADLENYIGSKDYSSLLSDPDIQAALQKDIGDEKPLLEEALSSPMITIQKHKTTTDPGWCILLKGSKAILALTIRNGVVELEAALRTKSQTEYWYADDGSSAQLNPRLEMEDPDPVFSFADKKVTVAPGVHRSTPHLDHNYADGTSGTGSGCDWDQKRYGYETPAACGE